MNHDDIGDPDFLMRLIFVVLGEMFQQVLDWLSWNELQTFISSLGYIVIVHLVLINKC